jgi:iron complex outermembrane receptor protein
MSSRKLLFCVAVIATAQYALPASAQEEEIIVTARKRQESLLRVPVVETALTQEQLEKYATNDVHSLVSRVPGLVVGSDFYGGAVNIRGVGANAPSPTTDQSVSLVIDGLQLSNGFALAVGMFDVGQLEVLKGPQALFYGKNSPAGVIALHSADPTDQFELVARGGYEVESVGRTGELIISGPVAPALKLRLAAKFSDMDGFFKNEAYAAPGYGGKDPKFRDVAPDQNWFVRGTALFNPSDVYDARLR